MKMWQRKSDMRWCDRVVINGKQKLITAKSKNELKAKLTDYNTYIKNGRTFTESAEAWETAHAAIIEKTTYNSYKPHIERAKAHFEGKYIKDITPDMVQAYVDKLAAQRYARDTVHRAVNVLNMIFNYEIVTPGSVMRVNPCTAVKLPKGLPKKRREPPSADQLIKVTPDTDMGLFAFFLQFTGLRRGELLALRWSDIDFENHVIHVRRTVSFTGNQPVVKERTKTAAGIRDVVLMDILADALPRSKKGYVFGGDTPLTNTQLRKRWIAWCREVGLAKEVVTQRKGKNGHIYKSSKWEPLVTPHQFRHEYASMLEDAGISEFAAKNLLGHASIVVTKDIYTHIRERKAGKAVADTLNRYIESRDQGKE